MPERRTKFISGIANSFWYRMELKERVERSLARIRIALQADGGDVDLVEVTDDGVVRVRLVGACAGCPMSTMTLAFGIERELKKEIPEIKRVEAV